MALSIVQMIVVHPSDMPSPKGVNLPSVRARYRLPGVIAPDLEFLASDRLERFVRFVVVVPLFQIEPSE